MLTWSINVLSLKGVICSAKRRFWRVFWTVSERISVYVCIATNSVIFVWVIVCTVVRSKAAYRILIPGRTGSASQAESSMFVLRYILFVGPLHLWRFRRTMMCSSISFYRVNSKAWPLCIRIRYTTLYKYLYDSTLLAGKVKPGYAKDSMGSSRVEVQELPEA